VACTPAAGRDGKYNANRVDKLSRKFFPTAFLVFNAVYWGYYLVSSSTSLDGDE